MKAQRAEREREREKWNCDKCRIEKVRILQDDLQNALRQIDELKARNREPEEKLLVAGARKGDTLPAKCMVVGDSVLRSIEAEHADTMVKCFSGIKTEQLHRVIEKADVGSPETVVMHVGTNDLRTTRH